MTNIASSPENTLDKGPETHNTEPATLPEVIPEFEPRNKKVLQSAIEYLGENRILDSDELQIISDRFSSKFAIENLSQSEMIELISMAAFSEISFDLLKNGGISGLMSLRNPQDMEGFELQNEVFGNGTHFDINTFNKINEIADKIPGVPINPYGDSRTVIDHAFEIQDRNNPGHPLAVGEISSLSRLPVAEGERPMYVGVTDEDIGNSSNPTPIDAAIYTLAQNEDGTLEPVEGVRITDPDGILNEFTEEGETSYIDSEAIDVVEGVVRLGGKKVTIPEGSYAFMIANENGSIFLTDRNGQVVAADYLENVATPAGHESMTRISEDQILLGQENILGDDIGIRLTTLNLDGRLSEATSQEIEPPREDFSLRALETIPGTEIVDGKPSVLGLYSTYVKPDDVKDGSVPEGGGNIAQIVRLDWDTDANEYIQTVIKTLSEFPLGSEANQGINEPDSIEVVNPQDLDNMEGIVLAITPESDLANEGGEVYIVADNNGNDYQTMVLGSINLTSEELGFNRQA